MRESIMDFKTLHLLLGKCIPNLILSSLRIESKEEIIVNINNDQEVRGLNSERKYILRV